MRTPKVPKNAQNSTLSSKKKKKKETVKNVLAFPFKEYWPDISPQDNLIILDDLLDNLPKLVAVGPKVPWSILRNVPKSERKAFKANYPDYAVKEWEQLTKQHRDGIVIGINDITKSLENKTVRAVLISRDVRPKVLVEHIVNQSIILGIPVLVVKELINIIEERCGIRSIAIAFTQHEKYEGTVNKIQDIAESYPVPENHINYLRSKQNEHVHTEECVIRKFIDTKKKKWKRKNIKIEPKVQPNDSKVVIKIEDDPDDTMTVIKLEPEDDPDDAKAIEDSDFFATKDHPLTEETITVMDDSSITETKITTKDHPDTEETITVMDDSSLTETKIATQIKICEKKREPENVNFDEIYLKKTHPVNRVFTPKQHSQRDSSGFLTFSNEFSCERKNIVDCYFYTPKVKYAPLKVKGLRPDKDRTKRKIEILKRIVGVKKNRSKKNKKKNKGNRQGGSY